MRSFSTAVKIAMAGGLFAALAFAAPVQAAPTTWSFTTTGTSGSCKFKNPGSFSSSFNFKASTCVGDNSAYGTNVMGNIYTSTANAKTIEAEAFHIAPATVTTTTTTTRVRKNGRWVNVTTTNTVTTPNDPLKTKLQRDFLGYYGGSIYGLGVENDGAPEHAVDNSDGWDFVVFKLPAGTNYNSYSITLSPWGSSQPFDMHATVLYGTPNASLGITGTDSFQNKTVEDLLSNGFTSMEFKGPWLDNPSTSKTINVTANSPFTYLIVAASLEPLRVNDNFKISAIVGSQVVRVAEPASLAAYGAGVLGLVAFASRRRRVLKRA